MFKGRVVGFKEVYALLDRIPAAVGEKEMQAGLHELAKPIVAEAAAGARQSRSVAPRHKQGHLDDNIDSFTRNSKGSSVKVAIGYRAKFFWGGWVEWGKDKVPARPYLRPAWDSNKSELLPRFAEIMWKRMRVLFAKAGRGARR